MVSGRICTSEERSCISPDTNGVYILGMLQGMLASYNPHGSAPEKPKLDMAAFCDRANYHWSAPSGLDHCLV